MPSSAETPPSPHTLRALARDGVIDAETLERALVLIRVLPDRSAWRRIIERTLLALGVVLVLAGVVVFFAYNWDDLLPRYKFALVVAGLLGSVWTAWICWGKPVGHAASIAASVLVGVWLGVYGQVYPTGSPWYLLFGLWLVLILGWTVASRFAGNWILAIALANATWVSYSTEGMVAFNKALPFVGVVLITGAALVVWEAGIQRGASWLAPRWAPRVLGAALLFATVSPSLDAIFDVFSHGALQVVAVVLLAVVCAGMTWYYRRVRPDPMMIAAVFMALIAVGASAIVRAFDASFWGFLVAAIAVLGGSTLAAGWLRKQTIGKEANGA
ncbi:MAG: DUF2157 domain-containing protein [Rhodothermales bacterium]